MPAGTGQYIGTNGLVTNISNAVDIRGSIGLSGNPGAGGNNGWSPELSIRSDGARRVLRLDDWLGGTGNEPAGTGQYIGQNGLVTSISSAIDIRGTAGLDGTGAGGANGWSPQFSVRLDGDRRVLRLDGWVGGTGNEPAGTGQYLGQNGFVTSISNAVDLRGVAGLRGDPGAAGENAWSPELAVVTSGSRRVLQVVDWFGGQGTKPATGQYIGSSGLVTNINNAVNIRGAAGEDALGSGIIGWGETPTNEGEDDALWVYTQPDFSNASQGTRIALSTYSNIDLNALAVDGSNIYLIDNDNNQLARLTLAGTFVDFVVDPLADGDWQGLAKDGSSLLYALDNVSDANP